MSRLDWLFTIAIAPLMALMLICWGIAELFNSFHQNLFKFINQLAEWFNL